jgi:hypothetical protein
MSMHDITLYNLIKNHVREIKGEDFQNLCERLCTVLFTDFRTITPAGEIGDKKKDGYSLSGNFFQFFGSIGSSIKTQEKLRKSFEGCLLENDNVTAFTFVTNRYPNGYTDDTKQVLAKKTGVPIDYWGPNELASKIIDLPVNKIDFVMGFPIASKLTENCIVYTEHESSFTELRMKNEHRKAIKYTIGFLISIFLAAIVLYAVLSYDLHPYFMSLCMAPVGIFMFGASTLHLIIQRTGTRDVFLGNGIFASRVSKEITLTYWLTAPCNYPSCSGRVTVYETSKYEQEKYSHFLMGRCSVDTDRHTFTFDKNRIGIRREFRNDAKPR